MTFTGSANTSGAGQAQLIKRGDSYFWTLNACPAGTTPNNGKCETPTTPPGHTESPPIWAPSVPGYVQNSRINREMGLAQMGQLHQRVSEQQTWAWDDCGKLCDHDPKPDPIWMRMDGGTLKEQGQGRGAYQSNIGTVQIGKDLRLERDADGNRRHLGVMFSYSQGNHSYYDKYAAVNGVIVDNKGVGGGKTDMASLGAYDTWYAPNGTYVDLVANISMLQNKYNDIQGGSASQNGQGLGLSVEVGRPWQIGDSAWQIEPQAQLAYQHVFLDQFFDGVRNISGQSDGTLRGRLGARLAWNADDGQQRTNTFYGIVNVLHDFKGNHASAAVGQDVLREQYGRTWGEIGVGAQMPLGKSTYLYGDVRYERSLDGSVDPIFNGRAAREGASGHIGVKHQW